MRSETTDSEQDRCMSRLPVPGIHSPVGDRVRIGSQYPFTGDGDVSVMSEMLSNETINNIYNYQG